MKSQKVYSILSRPPIILTLVVAFALSVCAMKNVSMAYHDLISGKAMDYASQMSERIKSCEIAQKNIDKAALVKIIENKPLTISFPPDLLEGQEESIWFDAYRKYFNLKVIKLEERSTDD